MEIDIKIIWSVTFRLDDDRPRTLFFETKFERDAFVSRLEEEGYLPDPGIAGVETLSTALYELQTLKRLISEELI